MIKALADIVAAIRIPIIRRTMETSIRENAFGNDSLKDDVFLDDFRGSDLLLFAEFFEYLAFMFDKRWGIFMLITVLRLSSVLVREIKASYQVNNTVTNLS